MTSIPSSVVSASFFDVNSVITSDEIANVKFMLMSNVPASQITGVSWIAKKLNMSSNDDRERIIETLIANDVVYYLCQKIGCSHGHLFSSMIEILEILASNVNFYKTNLAQMAVVSVLRVAFIMTKKMEAHEKTLSSVVYTLYVVLYGAKTADVPLRRLCDLSNMARFLKNLPTRLSSCYIMRLSVTRILCFVMENIELGVDEETKLSLLAVIKDTRLSIGGIVTEHVNSQREEYLQISLALLCTVCALAFRFCTDFKGEDFIKEIKSIMITTIIPHYHSTKSESGNLKAGVMEFVACLDELFKLNTDNRVLANSLASHGYLMYLLLMPSDAKFRKSISSLLSEIIAELSKDDFSCENSSTNAETGKPEGWTGFRDSINEGISALPSITGPTMDTSLMMNTRSTASIAFLVLLYHHSVKTLEYDIVSLPSVILKIVTLSDEQPIPVLKAVWFLFAISSLKFSAHSVSYYEEAAKSLAALLSNRNLKKCYTHNPAVLQHTLNYGESFPVELRYEVVRLWIEFGGDITLCLGAEHSPLINDCLVSTVEKSSEKLANRAAEIIVELKSDEKRWSEIHSRIWDRLPHALASWNSKTLANVKGLLKLVTGTKPEGKCLESYGESAATLAKALTNKELDDELKMLLLQYVHTLLEVSFERDSPSVVEFCLGEARLLRILYDTGFTKENFQLAAFCVDLLAFIVECQQKFNVQCDESSCVKIEPLKMLILLGRSNYVLYRGAVRLLVTLLNSREETALSAILSEFESVEAAEEAIYAWYRVLHIRIAKTQKNDWRLVYRCLIAMLTFCARRKYDNIVRGLCDYSGTYELMKWTMEHEYSDSIFFEYAELWLNYGVAYHSPNVESAVLSNRLKNLSFGLTQYDQVIEMLKQFREKCRRENAGQ